MKNKVPMKYRLGAKITALILLPILLILTIGAGFAGCAMVADGFYDVPMEEYRDSEFTGQAEGMASTALDIARFSSAQDMESLFYRQNVTAVTIEGTDGLHASWGQPAKGKAFRVYYQYGEQDVNGEKVPFQFPVRSATPGKVPVYEENYSLAIIDVYVDMELPMRDNFF